MKKEKKTKAPGFRCIRCEFYSTKDGGKCSKGKQCHAEHMACTDFNMNKRLFDY